MGGVLCKESCDKFEASVEKERCERSASCPWYSNVEVDWNGCRKFTRLPPPGQHPRLFFTKSEIPRIVARFRKSELGPTLRRCLYDAMRPIQELYNKIEALPEEEKLNPSSKETIDEYFKPNENRNVVILSAYALGYVYDEPEISEKAKKIAVFYAKVILRSRQIALEQDVKEKPYSVWHSNNWNLEVGWLFGGHSFALAYDLMYNDLEEEDRNTIRKAISQAVHGRRGWGMGWPTRRIQSNWASYHGDLLVLNAVVEDEEGFDKEVYALFCDLMVHYMDFAFYDSGHPIEDAYVLNLALREGSLCFMVMARRGYNIFNHPHFKKMWTNWLPYALEPNNSGLVYGGSSGNMWEYPTSAIVAKYMFPRDETIDHIYRHFMCQNGYKYARLNKIQSRIAALAFAIPALSEDLSEDEDPGRLGMPLNFVCRDRGKVIMRSDWSEQALWFTLDARPDGFLIGHDVCSRGAFVLNAHGRNWGYCPEWAWFINSSDYSIPSIDGVGQENKAPFVKLMTVSEGKCDSKYASCDLTYAYNWTWTSWAREGQDYTAHGYEVEPNDPSDFGFTVWWAPQKLHGERDVAFAGLHQWRKRFANVEKVFRSSIMVRASRPYVIIVDDMKKDEEMHKYSWSMTNAFDVELKSFDATDCMLGEIDGERRFLVRSLCREEYEFECTHRELEVSGKKSVPKNLPRQLTLSCQSTDVQFIFFLFSLPTDDSVPPLTTWDDAQSTLKVHDPETGETQLISFGVGADGATSMEVTQTNACNI